MTIENPLYLQTKEYSARQDRFIADYLFTEGVTDAAAGELLVTQRAAGANMSVDIADGTAVIDGDDVALQGAYLVRVTAGENIAISAPPVSDSRVDLVVLRVYDSTATGGDPLDDGAVFDVIEGVAAASPVAPATPATAIVLARVTVASGVTSIATANITDQRTQVNKSTLAIGTQAEPMTTTERDALTGADLFTGRLIFNTTAGALQTYGGASLGWISGRADVQTFTSSGTWTKPSGAQTIFLSAVGAGGGGNGSSAAACGAGGGGGAIATAQMPASAVGASVTVTVGAGGVGATNSTLAGNAGGASTFGTYLSAFGGGGAGAGAGTGGGGGGTGGAGNGVAAGRGGYPGGDASTPAMGGAGARGAAAANSNGESAELGGGGGGAGRSTNGAGTLGGSSIYAAGGGGGGGLAAGNAGGAGGGHGSYVTGSAANGGAAASPGVAGAAYQGGGGGGGGASAANSLGGAGGVPGGGGGGAGHTTSGNGTGGTGARGEVVVVTICL